MRRAGPDDAADAAPGRRVARRRVRRGALGPAEHAPRRADSRAAAGAAAILKTIGATVNQIAAVLQTTFGQAVEAVGSLLASIGFTSDVIASIGGAFTSFGNDVVDFFKGLF